MVVEHGLGKREKNPLKNKKIPPYNKNSPPEKQNKIIPLFGEHRKFHFCMDSSAFCHYRFFPWSFRFSELPSLVPFPQTTKKKKKKDPFQRIVV
jgi:hypothetical protein